MNTAAVKLNNVSKFYKLYDSPKDRLKEALHPGGKKHHREFYALKNINLEIKKGEILGIVGRNGSGKSTLLKLISSVLQPSSGNITVNGSVSALLELGSGLHPEFTGIQNIYFSGTMMGFSRKEMEEKMEPIIAFADIGDYIRQPLKTYSSGMRARLGFALAINMDPEILVLDEVLAVGDELFKRKCFVKIEEFFKSGCTVLYVSHAASSVNELCTRAIFLDKGEKILEGLPKFVTMHYQKFLYEKPANISKVRNEILQLDKDEKKKNAFAAATKNTKRQKPNIEKKKTPIPIAEKKPEQKAFYLPDFKPKSTVMQKNYDVDIFDVHIRTLDGEKVNALVMNEQYIYSFKIKFNVDAFDVGVGTPFKTEKGLNVSSYNMFGDYIKKVETGTTLSVDCQFNCKFIPGIYYANAAVGSIINGERVVLNRLLDALVFKVQSNKNTKKYGGLIYCDQNLAIKQIEMDS